MFSINKRHEKGSRGKVKGTMRRNVCWPVLKPFTILWENALETSRQDSFLNLSCIKDPQACCHWSSHSLTLCVQNRDFFFNAKLLKLFCSNIYIFLVILFGNISFDFFLWISHVSTSYPALLHILYAQISVLSHYPCFSALLFLAHGNINTYDYFLFLQQWQTMKINHRSCTTNNWTILNICYRKSLNRAELKSKMKYISIV